MVLFLPIGLVMLAIGGICGGIYIILSIFTNLLDRHYIRAALWSIVALFLLNMFVWHVKDMHYLYITIACAGVFFAARKFYKSTTQTIPPFGAMPDAAGNVIPFVKATREERERVMRIQGHNCANPYCNMDLRGRTPHWDYIIPRSRGGTDSVHNMQYLCDTCNQNKKDQHWLEFLYRYATNLGQDPNTNQEPWKRWVLMRSNNGLQCG